MQVNELIDLAPALELAVLGALLALVPVAVVVWRARRQGVSGWPAWQRVLTVATLFLTLDLVVFGAFTRLTDSGLGCPDWPGCYGELTPFHAREDIGAAHAEAPHGPVSPSKAWIEMIHRYLATSVGALITGLMILAWRKRHWPGGLSPWWATATFVWVCLQGAFGALTVTLKLQPIIVTGHLLGAMLGVAMLTAQARVLDPAPIGAGPGAEARRQAWASARLRRWGVAVLALLTLQIASGAWVSTNYAVLACSEFPMCQGQWWPPMAFEDAFRLMRPLGGDGQGGAISMAGLTAIHMVHRLMAMGVALALLTFAWRLAAWRADGQADRPWRKESRVLFGLVAWQVISGLSNVVLDWPLAAALSHTLGAALLVWWLVRLLVLPRAVPAPAAVPAGACHQGHHGTAVQASAS
jgi:cytochrome c oxidase assembly protein subunit 15